MEEIIINPAEQRVIILPVLETETKTKSGIIIPKGTGEDKPGVGWVIASGKGSKDYPMVYTLGSRVIYSQYAGLNIKLNIMNHGEHVYKVMNQLDIMATIEEVN